MNTELIVSKRGTGLRPQILEVVMRLVFGFVLVVSMALGGVACGSDSSSGGSVDSDAALQGMMQTIALDFAQVLADVAPSQDVLAVKGLGQKATADCPEGGSATWSGEFGTGTLDLSACQMRGVAVTGNLAGFLDSYPGGISASMLRGTISTSGGFTTQLTVNDMYVGAQLPIADATTYWEIAATTPEGKNLCAWSGGAGCAPLM
jgi:hypothetical protein